MTSIQGCRYPYKDQASVAYSVAFIFQVYSPMNSEIDKLKGISRPFNFSSAFSLVSFALISMTKYLEDDFYCILNTVLKAGILTPMVLPKSL